MEREVDDHVCAVVRGKLQAVIDCILAKSKSWGCRSRMGESRDFDAEEVTCDAKSLKLGLYQPKHIALDFRD